MEKVDLIIEEQDEMKAHGYEFLLWHRKWREYDSTYTCTWLTHQLSNSERQHIPEDSGIYTLLVQPSIANHPACSYLMYVGQTVSLHKRFGEYLTKERRESGRPKIFRLLNKYSDYVWFCFTLVPKAYLDDVESRLMKAYLPPCNDRLPTEIRPVTGAF